MRTRFRLRTLGPLCAAITLGAVAPAFADDDLWRHQRHQGEEWREREWHRHEWREHEWREHEWREQAWRRQYYPPPVVTTPPYGYYASPPAY
jgi:hypothetical protein